jgi:hypothetical protein
VWALYLQLDSITICVMLGFPTGRAHTAVLCGRRGTWLLAKLWQLIGRAPLVASCLFSCSHSARAGPPPRPPRAEPDPALGAGQRALVLVEAASRYCIVSFESMAHGWPGWSVDWVPGLRAARCLRAGLVAWC